MVREVASLWQEPLDTVKVAQELANVDVANAKTELCQFARPPRGDWVWLHGDSVQAKWGRQKMFMDTVLVVLETLSRLDNKEVYEAMVYYLYEYPWTTARSKEMASAYVSSHDYQLDIIDQIKPSFTTTHSNVSSAGRKKIKTSQPAKFNSISFDEPNVPWRQDLAVVALFEHFISTADLQANWAFVTPTVLNILDDAEAMHKQKGCELAQKVVSRVDPHFLKITGLLPVIWDAVTPCLTYLPPGIPVDQSKVVVSRAIDALVVLAKLDKDPAGRLDEIMRDGIINGIRHSGERIALAMMFLQKLHIVVQELGINAVRHLQSLMTIFVNILSDPFGNAYKPLFTQTCTTLLKVMETCAMRIHCYKFEILRGIGSAWNRIDHDQDDQDKADAQAALSKVLLSLKEITSVDTSKLANESGVFRI